MLMSSLPVPVLTRDYTDRSQVKLISLKVRCMFTALAILSHPALLLPETQTLISFTVKFPERPGQKGSR